MKRFLTEKLISWKTNSARKPLIVKGIRQCGKTFSILEFGKQNFQNIHNINFEKNGNLEKIFEPNLNPKRILEALNFHLKTTIDINNDLVFFDEIQTCPKAITSLKYFQEELPQLALCAAGSLLGVHLNSSPFPVGKVDFLEAHPMSFEEFLLALEDHQAIEYLNQTAKIPDYAHEHLWEQMKKYFITGGLPEVVKTFCELKENLFAAFAKTREKQSELIIAYAADMAKHSGKVNAMHIDRVWHSVPAQLARENNGGAKKFQFKGVIPGVSRYSRLVNVVDWLEAAGLIIKVPIVNTAQLPLSAYTKENSFKLFLSDIGLLGALSNLSPNNIWQYDYGTYKGYFAENFVLQEFYAANATNIYCWQEGHSEIEFLREINGNIIPIEIKSGINTQAKSLKVFINKYHPAFSIKMSGNGFYLDETTKIRHYPLYQASKI